MKHLIKRTNTLAVDRLFIPADINESIEKEILNYYDLNNEIIETTNETTLYSNQETIIYPTNNINLFGYHTSVYQFPSTYTHLINSGNVSGISLLIDKFLHNNCLYRLHLPGNRTVDQNNKNFIKRLVDTTIQDFPDGIITLRSIKITKLEKVNIIKTNSTFDGTIIDYQYRNVLFSDKDKGNNNICKDVDLNSNQLFKIVAKYSTKYFVDDLNNRIVGHDSKIEILSLKRRPLIID